MGSASCRLVLADCWAWLAEELVLAGQLRVLAQVPVWALEQVLPSVERELSQELEPEWAWLALALVLGDLV